MSSNYKELIKRQVLDEGTFVRMTLKGQLRGQELQWRRVIVRPVLIKQARHLQFSYFDEKQDITKKDRKSTRLNSSHSQISYAVFCLKKKKNRQHRDGSKRVHLHYYGATARSTQESELYCPHWNKSDT